MSEPVKKRSLGSYLSSLEERREERERSEQQQQQEKPDEPAGDHAEPEQESTHMEEEAAGEELTAPRYSLTREGLKNLLEVRNDNNGTSEVELPKVSENKKHSDNEDSSALSEIDSDAPTEPASPPRPKRGRLIRGDKLESATSSRQSSVPILNHDGGSESDLSDLDELTGAKISSSIIHGDSSPMRHNEAKRKIPIENIPNKRIKHNAISKIPKTKKGVHRDAGGRTKLQIACDKGKYEQAKKLIEEDGYDVNDQDNAGNTPLHEAALNGHLEIVKLLVEHGADVNKQSYEMFLDTPLIDASANSHIKVVKYLLDHGADPTMVNAKGLSAIESIEEESDLEDEESKIIHKMKDMLKRATRKYVKHDHRNLQSRSLSRHSDEGEKQLNHDEDFYWTDISSKVGRNKLLRASKEGNLAYVGSYLENGGRPDFKCFLESCIYGHDDVVSLFLAFGAQVNMSNKDGQTPLMLSVGRGHLGVVKLLLEAGADPQKFDRRGKSILHYSKHSSLGLSDSEEVKLIKDTIKKQYGYIKDEGDSGNESSTSPDVSEPLSSKEEQQECPTKNKTISEQNVSVAAADRELLQQQDIIPTPSTDTDNAKVKVNEEKIDSRAATPLSSHKSMSPTHQLSVPPPPPKETDEEKLARLKSEEEYRMKRLQQKRRKEQEFLSRLAEEERKRVEEKEKLRQLEEEKKVRAQREELQKQEELKNKNEVERRQHIRSHYPIGLKLVDFNDTTDYERYGPTYYHTNNGKRWVLDLQLSVITKSETAKFQEQDADSKPVYPNHYLQLWNIYKFIFLYGGNSRPVDLSAHPRSMQLEIEQEEYLKFCKLPLYWINLANIKIENTAVEAWIQSTMTEFQLTDEKDLAASVQKETVHEVNINTIALKTDNPQETQTQGHHSSSLPFLFPAKYQARPAVLQWLNAPRSLW